MRWLSGQCLKGVWKVSKDCLEGFYGMSEWYFGKSGLVKSEQVKSGQVKSRQVKSGQIKLGQVHSGQGY